METSYLQKLHDGVEAFFEYKDDATWKQRVLDSINDLTESEAEMVDDVMNQIWFERSSIGGFNYKYYQGFQPNMFEDLSLVDSEDLQTEIDNFTSVGAYDIQTTLDSDGTYTVAGRFPDINAYERLGYEGQVEGRTLNNLENWDGLLDLALELTKKARSYFWPIDPNLTQNDLQF